MPLSFLKNIHYEKTCFIFGAGPSLHFENIELIKNFDNKISIAVNSSIKKIYWADYFLTDDWDTCNWDYFQEIWKLKCKKLFYRKKLFPYQELFTEHKNDVIWFDHKEYMVGNLEIAKNIILTKDEPIIGARTSVASAIHFAYIMGCSPIVLFGVDCSHKEGNRYYWQFEGEKKCKRIDGKNIFKILNHSDDFIKYWKLFRIKNPHVEIFNASRYSRLSVFPKTTIEDLKNG